MRPRDFGLGLADLLFPPVCLICDALGEPFCAACRGTIAPVEPECRVPDVAEIRSVGYHEDALRKAVLRLKFDLKTALVAPLGALLARELDAASADWGADALVPVPIHWSRRLRRGFNQSELLARAMGEAMVLPALTRVRRTPSQVRLTREGRRRNLRRALRASDGVSVRGRRVVLIDDVTTTGATLSECAAVLRNAGAAEIFALTLTYEGARNQEGAPSGRRTLP